VNRALTWGIDDTPNARIAYCAGMKATLDPSAGDAEAIHQINNGLCVFFTCAALWMAWWPWFAGFVHRWAYEPVGVMPNP
jgi:hypothetical protein